MLPARRSLTFVALLAVASGCSGWRETEPELYPVLSARGNITYVSKDAYVPAIEEDPRNALLIQQARSKPIQAQGQDPPNELMTQQGRSEPNPVPKPDPETENIRRLEREVRLREQERDLLVEQDERPKVGVAERLRQQQRERQQSQRSRRDQERQDDAMRHQRESQRLNDGLRELLQTQELIRQQPDNR